MKIDFTQITTIIKILRLLSWSTLYLNAVAMSFGQTPDSMGQIGSEIMINEFMASNDTIAPDNHDFDDYSDWIELFNPTDQDVPLDGYFLTDNLLAPMKWPFPTGAIIRANGYLLIRADGMNAGPGETHVREFSPWGSFQTIGYHTNFKLSAEAEELALYRITGDATTNEFIGFGDNWDYWDQGGLIGTDWTLSDFDTSNWANGPAQLGYGESDEATILDFGGNSQDKRITYYFRNSFEVEDLSSFAELNLRILVDDGAIIYMNGQEVLRVRIPDGSFDSETRATTEAPEDVIDDFSLPLETLKLGTNILAVEVHQVSRTSSDISFDLELTGRSFSGDLEVVDSVKYDQQFPDTSYGRQFEDNESWTLFSDATPLGPNTAEPITSRLVSANVTFSLAGGFYEELQSLAIASSAPDSRIYYTLNGAAPTQQSLLYTSPLQISSTQVVRARAYENGKFAGPINSSTFWIGETPSTVPTVSLIFDPATFFDSEIGIYSNVFKGMEAPLSMEFYEPNGELGFKVNAGAKIAGENIWRFAQKPLNITLRGKYGDDLIPYQLFPNERVGYFGQLALRNGGDNWYNAMIRDAMTPAIAEGFIKSEIQNYRPCVAYFNGAFWGIYNIREKLDPTYFAQKFHLNSGEYDYLEYAHTIGNVTSLVVDEGSDLDYKTLLQFVADNDLALPENYLLIGEMMDLDNFIDYLIFQNYTYNSSWSHNREFWKAKTPGAKWRWVIADLDRGLNMSNINSTLIDNIIDGYSIAGALIKNTEFKRKLVQKHAALMSSAFYPGRIAEIVDAYALEVEDVIDRHIERWASQGGISSRASRQAELDEIKQFANERGTAVYEGLSSHLGLTGTELLHLNVQPSESGVILVEGAPWAPQWTKTMRLFKDLDAHVSIQPKPGFQFSHWLELPELGSEESIELKMDQECNLTAVMIPLDQTLISGSITESTTLSNSRSPYLVTDTLTVESGVILTIEGGTEIKCLPGVDIIVHGSLNIEGNETAPVNVTGSKGKSNWGSIVFDQTSATSNINGLFLRDATRGPDPVYFKGAISIYKSTVIIEHADISCAAPIYSLDGNVILKNSRIYTPNTGDGINVKGGTGEVIECVFLGNTAPDTDAIDFDGVTEGLIQNNRIYGFRGPNSDAIDIGEGARNLRIVGNRIFNITDKGVSVGQASETTIKQNLIVDCALGVAVKDYGSSAFIDQNTFAFTDTGVAVYEKNLLKGGGSAVVENCIFYENQSAPSSTDQFSSISISFSIANNAVVLGSSNFVADPLFTNPLSYDFSLSPASPAIDAGNPTHDKDPDGSITDIGAPYQFNPNDYPFTPPNVVKINEILAFSNGGEVDWIELYNPTNDTVDISGWYLSDDKEDLLKFQIPLDTLILPGDFVVYYEDQHFGINSQHSGSKTGFALSNTGETVYLYGASGDLNLPFIESESFGPSEPGVTMGRHYKPSTDTFNFVELQSTTPGTQNSYPKVGPIVISEIFYHPNSGLDSEFIELLNISNQTQSLYDTDLNASWIIGSGIDLIFSDTNPVLLEPNERILMVKNQKDFVIEFPNVQDIQIIEWTSGSLSNSGEKLELLRPGALDSFGSQTYVRIDRVIYEDIEPWPAEADGFGYSLQKQSDFLYGNDPSAWFAASPSPGLGSHDNLNGYWMWAQSQGLELGSNQPLDDADADGIPNILEFLRLSDPNTPGQAPMFHFVKNADMLELQFEVPGYDDLLEYTLEYSTNLSSNEWTSFPLGPDNLVFENERLLLLKVQFSNTTESPVYYRISILLK